MLYALNFITVVSKMLSNINIFESSSGVCVQLTFGPQLDGSQGEPEAMNVGHTPEDLL